MAKTCKASVLHGARDLRLEDRTIDPPGPNELQIGIEATGLCGSDLHYYRHYRNGDIAVQEPMSLGHESAGTVLVVGARVEGFKAGDRVALEVGLPCGVCERCGEGRYNICKNLRFRSSAKSFPHLQGTLQERINHPAPWCHKLPENVSFDLGALVEPLSVAIHATRRAQIVPSASVLVFGAGAIGLLCAAMCLTARAARIKIADIQPDRVAFATENGFAHEGLIVPLGRGETIQKQIVAAKEVALSACQKQSGESAEFDVVFECTGVEASTQAAIYATRPGGKVIVVGMGMPIQTLPISAAALREVDILGTFRYANTYPEALRAVANRSATSPDLNKIITHHFLGLDSVNRAFETAGKTHDDEGALVLKVIVKMDEVKASVAGPSP